MEGINFASFKIPFDSINLDYLLARRYESSYKESTIPIWTSSEDKFYEFEISREKLGDYHLENQIEEKKQCCHICNIDVPLTCLNEHNNSFKHKVCQRIAECALDRITKHVKQERDYSNITTRDTTNTYFCEHCAVVVADKNRKDHEETEGHAISVVHDRLLNGLLLTYLDKDRVKEVVRPENRTDSDDSENYDENNYTAMEFVGECDENHSDGITSNDEDIKSIITEKHDIVVDANDEKVTFKTNDDETSKHAISQSLNLKTYIKLITDADNLLQHRLKIVDEGFIQITTRSGDRIKVAIDNFHGICKGNTVKCLICKTSLDDAEAHKFEKRHMELLMSPILNRNCLRQISEIEYHCILCNEVIENFELHIETKEHKSVLNNTLYCTVCNVVVPCNKKHNGTMQHRHNLWLLKEKDAKNYQMRRSQNPDMLICIVCNVEVPNEIKQVNMHMESKDHEYEYKLMLTENHMDHEINETRAYETTYCHICNARMIIGDEIYHIDGKNHNNNLNKYYQTHKVLSKRCNVAKDAIERSEHNTCDDSTENYKEIIIQDTDVVFQQVEKSQVKNVMNDNSIFEHDVTGQLDVKINNNIQSKDEEPMQSMLSYGSMTGNVRIEYVKSQNEVKNTETKKRALRKIKIIEPTENSSVVKCKVCVVMIPNTKKNTDEHLKSRRHRKELDKYLENNKISKFDGEFFWSACNDLIKTDEFVHADSEYHKLRNGSRELDKQIDDKYATKTSTQQELSVSIKTKSKVLKQVGLHYLLQRENSKELSCEICRVRFENNCAMLHIVSRRHKSNYVRLFENNKLQMVKDKMHCRACNVPIEDMSELSHVKTIEHALKIGSTSVPTNESSSDTYKNISEDVDIYSKDNQMVILNSKSNVVKQRNKFKSTCVPANEAFSLLMKSISKVYEEHSAIYTKDNQVIMQNSKSVDVITGTNTRRGNFIPEDSSTFKRSFSKDDIEDECSFEDSQMVHLDRKSMDVVKVTSTQSTYVPPNEASSLMKTIPEDNIDAAAHSKDNQKVIQNESIDVQNTFKMKEQIGEISYQLKGAGKQIKCRICDFMIPNEAKDIIQHINGIWHLALYNSTLLKNYLTKVHDKIYCGACNEYMAESNMLDHIHNGTHKLKELNEQKPKRKRKRSKRSGNRESGGVSDSVGLQQNDLWSSNIDCDAVD